MSVPIRAILMYKAPELGAVKTRLAKSIGEAAALELYRWMGKRQLQVIPSDWDVEVRFSPEDQESSMREWLGTEVHLNPQGDGDLGDRMRRAARSSYLQDKDRRVIFLGADCLGLDKAALKDAAVTLDHSDYVLGPALDGGYYLLGMNRLEPSLFEGIDWGSSSVLNETIKRIQNVNQRYERLEERVDVDNWDDLKDQRRLVDPSLWARLSLPDA